MANKNEQIDRYRVGFFHSLTPASYAILVAIAAGIVLGAGMLLFDSGDKGSDVIQQPGQQAKIPPAQPRGAQSPPHDLGAQPVAGVSPQPPSEPTEQEWRSGIALLEGKHSDSEEPWERKGAKADDQQRPVPADLRGQGAQATAPISAPAPAPKPEPTVSATKQITQTPSAAPAPAQAPKPEPMTQLLTAATPAATAPSAAPAPAQAPKPQPAQQLATIKAPATTPVPSPAAVQPSASAAASMPDPAAQQLAAVKPVPIAPSQPAPVQAEKPQGRWVVQLSVNRNPDLANGWARRLQDLGANAYVLQRKTVQGDLHVLRMGFFSSREEAKSKAEQISAKTGLSGYSLLEAGPEEKERFAHRR
jgi:hypothetical protein